MKKKYSIIEVKRDGTRRLLTRCLTGKQALKETYKLAERFKESEIIIEKGE
jgi:hypothetical protein